MKSVRLNVVNIRTITVVGILLTASLILTVKVSGQQGLTEPMQGDLTSAFTYQGKLDQNSAPVTGSCDLQFSLYDALTLGTQIGATQTLTNQTITNGLFSVQLNSSGEFGAEAFNGQARWLDIAVRCPSGSGDYNSLSPRQALSAAPYALYSLESGHALSAQDFSGELDGDVTGEQDDTLVTALQNQPITDTVPTTGQVLKYNGTQWQPDDNNFSGELDGDVTGELDDTVVTALQNQPIIDTVPTTGQALKYNGTQWQPDADVHNDYQGLIVVAKSGGDFSTITDALNSVTGSESDRYLIKVMPGVYTETVTMESYVDIEGSGEGLTTIAHSGIAEDGNVTVLGADHAELRFLTVENKSGFVNSLGIKNSQASPSLARIHVVVSNLSSTGQSTRNYGIYNEYSSPKMSDIEISVEGAGSAWSRGIYNIHSSSPLMFNIRLNVINSATTYGVHNKDQSSPDMTNISITISGGGYKNYVVYDEENSAPTMKDMGITVSGPSGSMNYGIYNTTKASPSIKNVIVNVSGGSESYGLYADDTTSGESTITIIRIFDSQIFATNSNIFLFSGTNIDTELYVANTLLGGDGNVSVIDATITCFGVYDENFTALNATCGATP